MEITTHQSHCLQERSLGSIGIRQKESGGHNIQYRIVNVNAIDFIKGGTLLCSLFISLDCSLSEVPYREVGGDYGGYDVKSGNYNYSGVV